jgi:hypothetical protein
MIVGHILKINVRRWKKTNGAIFYEPMKEEYSW